MTLEEIRELIRVVTETGVAELEVQRGDNRVRIRRILRPQLQSFAAPPAAAAVEQGPELAISATATGTRIRRRRGRARSAQRPEPHHHQVADRRHLLRIAFAGFAAFRELGDRCNPGRCCASSNR